MYVYILGYKYQRTNLYIDRDVPQNKESSVQYILTRAADLSTPIRKNAM